MKIQPRVIPILLLKNNGLYKTTKFKEPKYIGDPVNAIKIFNEKEVDELIFLDIMASREGCPPNFEMLKDIASECFMPLCYGGGINSVEMIREVLNVGVEKVSINSHAVRNPELITHAANFFGTSTIVVSIDVKKNFFGKYEVYINDGQEKTSWNPVDLAKEVERRGAGELLINSIDKDGTMTGYDLPLIKSIASTVNIPVIAVGGASSTTDFVKSVNEGYASAAGAGSLFVFQGKHRAVLITYPTQAELKSIFN
jgi:cyclase